MISTATEWKREIHVFRYVFIETFCFLCNQLVGTSNVSEM